MYGVKSSAEWRAKIQNGYWAIKWFAWLGIIVLSFFIPNSFIMGWGHYVNMPGATIFILIQVILLIDFAYQVSEALLGWWEDTDDRRYLGTKNLINGRGFTCPNWFLLCWINNGYWIYVRLVWIF
jgi:hypothetical protein